MKHNISHGVFVGTCAPKSFPLTFRSDHSNKESMKAPHGPQEMPAAHGPGLLYKSHLRSKNFKEFRHDLIMISMKTVKTLGLSQQEQQVTRRH